MFHNNASNYLIVKENRSVTIILKNNNKIIKK